MQRAKPEASRYLAGFLPHGTPTSSRCPRNDDKNMSFFQRILQFSKEVRMELKKVVWPTREETVRYTIVVVAVSLVAAGFLGGLDFIFQYLVSRFIL
ncbi:MAG: preprotein translocase subunit SecE [bacterium]|nr:preprotein translocase subunit SecE [bacterium]